MTMTIFEISEETPAARLSKGSPAFERRSSDQRIDEWLTVALEDSFPCSDPMSSMRVD
jgi:hypothetical protein